ncbi:MAG TPA: nucleotide sugar dehydrogenase [Thermoanaerobaculia bacterium]
MKPVNEQETTTRTATGLSEQLRQRIADRTAAVGVIGLGYVGLPLILTFSEAGFPTVGFDVDVQKIESLRRGRMYIQHLDGARLTRAVSGGRFQATEDFARIAEADVVIICVPTPLTPQREPDMSYVTSTVRQVAAHLREGQLIVLESTTYPGTTDELVRGLLEETGLKCGEQFFLAFSPEREDPGNPSFSTGTIPKVVGGVDQLAGDLAQAVYDTVVKRTVRVRNARTAEATKLVENIFRAVNIALANELKMVFDRMGIDVWEVLDAASTKPFGFMRFDPGPGWGGHCIPLDPFYLSWKAREYGAAPRFIELAGEINVQMPHYVIEKLQLALNERGRPLRDSRVLLLGLAYKRDIDDPRESPAFEILERLIHLGVRVSYHDPHIPLAPKMRTWPKLPALASQALEPEMLAEQDAVLVVTDHTAVDYKKVLEHARLVVDTRGVYREPHRKVVKA